MDFDYNKKSPFYINTFYRTLIDINKNHTVNLFSKENIFTAKYTQINFKNKIIKIKNNENKYNSVKRNKHNKIKTINQKNNYNERKLKLCNLNEEIRKKNFENIKKKAKTNLNEQNNLVIINKSNNNKLLRFTTNNFIKDKSIITNTTRKQAVKDYKISKYKIKSTENYSFIHNKNTSLIKPSYLLGKLIGKGSYAYVYTYIEIPSQSQFAIKIYEKRKMNTNTKRKIIENEIQTLKMIDHINIVKLINTEETKNEIKLVLELINGDNLSFFNKRNMINSCKNNIKKDILKQIITAFCYLHKNNIYHRDIKMENILVNDDNIVKVIDFGFAIHCQKYERLNLFCGTPNYMSPEIIKKVQYLGGPNDIWSFGILMHKFLTNKYPFIGSNTEDLNKKITTEDPILDDSLTYQEVDIIESCLRKNPYDRVTFNNLLNTKYFSDILHI